MPFIIDRGERKLIRRRLLDENGDPISDWDMVIDVRFYLMLGGREYKLFSKENGLVTFDGTHAEFEISQTQTEEFPPTQYQLKAELDVYDNRFTELVTDIQWEAPFMRIRPLSRDNEFSKSVDTEDIKFSVLPILLSQLPKPAVTFYDIGINSFSFTYTPVDFAIKHQYKIKESDEYIDIPDGVVDLDVTNLVENTDYVLHVRAIDAEDNPGLVAIRYIRTDSSPIVTAPIIEKDPRNDNGEDGILYFSRTNSVPGATTYEYYLSSLNAWTEYGTNPNFVITGAPINETILINVRAKNAAGPGPASNQISINTAQDAPAQTTIFGTGSTSDSVDLFITEPAGADGYIVKWDAATGYNAPSGEITVLSENLLVSGLNKYIRVTGLSSTTVYDFQVLPYNEGGTALASTEQVETLIPTIQFVEVDGFSRFYDYLPGGGYTPYGYIKFGYEPKAASYILRPGATAVSNGAVDIPIISFSPDVNGKIQQVFAAPYANFEGNADYKVLGVSQTGKITPTGDWISVSFSPEPPTPVTVNSITESPSSVIIDYTPGLRQHGSLVQVFLRDQLSNPVQTFAVTQPGDDPLTDLEITGLASNADYDVYILPYSYYEPYLIEDVISRIDILSYLALNDVNKIQVSTSIAIQNPSFDTLNFANGINVNGHFITVARTNAGGPSYNIRINNGIYVLMPNLTFTFESLQPGSSHTVQIRSQDVDNLITSDWISIIVQTDGEVIVETTQQPQNFTTA